LSSGISSESALVSGCFFIASSFNGRYRGSHAAAQLRTLPVAEWSQRLDVFFVGRRL